jgi:transcriptional regulator with XRE-family HTH domain
MTIKDVIQRIGYFRNKANLSARELSLRIDKHEGYINKLESKDFNLPTEMLLKIIDALEITPEEFFCLGEQYNKETKELLEKFNKLSANNKQTIIDLVNKLQ